jgi:tetratricopeptide (TPR) repeat protein
MPGKETTRAGAGGPATDEQDDPLLAAAANESFPEFANSVDAPRRESARPSAAPMWFFGTVVCALLALQTVEMLGRRDAIGEGRGGARGGGARGGGEEGDGTDHAPPESAADRILNDARAGVDRGVYETAIRLLEPMIEKPELLTKSERRESYLLLSTAYRALKDIPRSQAYYLRAIDQSVDRHEPALVLEEASELLADGRFSDARRKLCGLLARRDGLEKDDDALAALAAARVADSWYAQAAASQALAPLPDASREASR